MKHQFMLVCSHYTCLSLLHRDKAVLFYSSYRKIAKIHSLHDAVQELCDKSEDLELNENFFTEKLDQTQIQNKWVIHKNISPG